MISTADDMLLFIHPAGPAAAQPIVDALTRRMAGAWLTRTVGEVIYRGFHRCTGCGAVSDNRDHYVPTVDGARLKTNSLAIHYLGCHRDDVPPTELDKVARLEAMPTEPMVKQLRGHG